MPRRGRSNRNYPINPLTSYIFLPIFTGVILVEDLGVVGLFESPRDVRKRQEPRIGAMDLLLLEYDIRKIINKKGGLLEVLANDSDEQYIEDDETFKLVLSWLAVELVAKKLQKKKAGKK